MAHIPITGIAEQRRCCLHFTFSLRARGGNRTFLHWVVEHDVLFGQLQQHRVVKELVDAHVLAQALLKEEHSVNTSAIVC